MKQSLVAFACAAIGVLMLLSCAAARADDVADKAAVCSGCHGANGVPMDKSIPVIWGQNEGYIYLELRDFKSGHRKSDIMSQVALGLEKPDMLALAAYFAAKPWPRLGQPSAPAAVARHAETIDGSAGCRGCHLANWQGDSTTPRLAGQNEQYLHDTMLKFRSGERANNPWMSALLKTYSDTDIDVLAKYLAGY